MTSHHDVEGLAAKLNEAQRRALIDAGRYTFGNGFYVPAHTEVRIVRSLTQLGLLHRTIEGKLVKAGLALRSHLIGTGNG